MMSLSGHPDRKAFIARDAAERHRLRGLLGDQLCRDLLRLLNEEIHTDLVLHVGQTQFKVHTSVLWARAPGFYRQVRGLDAGDAVTVHNVEPSEMLTFLKLVYSSPWNVKEREDHILRLLKDQSEVSCDPCRNVQRTAPQSVENGNIPSSQEHGVQGEDREENHNHDAIDLSGCEVSCDLGKDLLSLLKQSFATDVTIQVEETLFHVHRAILCARSCYFAAMLSGCWAETSRDIIKIQGVKQAHMMVVLHCIYGGIMDLPKTIDLGQILTVADMYGLEGLREVAIYTLKRDYCHFLLKPVIGMQQSVLECLYIAHSVQEEPLYTSCMRWIEKYFVKCWSERSFANLPADLQESCLNALVQSLSYRNAAFLLMESDRLICSLPGVKWAERAQNLASELQEECVKFMVANFSQIIKSQSFAHLLQAQGMSSRPYLLEHVFNEIEKNISFQNCSSLFMAVDDLLHLASENEMVFTCKIQALRDKLWSFLVQSFYAVRHTEGWRLMRPSDQDQIRAAAFDKGDDRRLAKKPTFTSSQQIRSKSVKLGESQTAENKRLSDSALSSYRKMKSDSLGASGHTNHITRNSSGKGKEDDVKGKDVKKTVTKGAKEAKPAEKAATARPKVSLKTKSENHDQSKTESCASKGDTAAGTAKPPAASARTGTRPKVTNGSTNPLTKAKALKKSDKDPASPVKGCVKSTNGNGELPHTSSSSGENGQEHIADEQPGSATSSPPVNKTGKNSLDCSKDSGVGTKSKSTVKISNGTAAKRKSNEGESQEPRSSSAKKPTDGGNDPGLQKKKGIKLTTCAAQRPKSAPAALTKKQGDGSTMPKSVSSKPPEAKQDAKSVTQSPSGDKHAPLNKKTTIRTTTTSAIKTQLNVSSNKHGGSKAPVQNHKEPKAKVPSVLKTSMVNHKSQKSVRNNHSQQDPTKPDAPGSRAPVVDEGNQAAASCQSVEEAGHLEGTPLSAHKDTSMGNQESVIQKPNIDHCHCQENSPPASVLLHRSNSEDDLTGAINETKAAIAGGAGSGDVLEQKSDCKNICDSENSSESELCSVKEVERVPKPKESENMAFPEFSQTSSANFQRRHNDAESRLNGADRQHAPNSMEHFMNRSSPGYQRDLDIDEVADSRVNDMHYIGQWNNHLHERESPESESGSASTSSDDIKPRSEDYDAGGSQDDDGSNERGISKCSTMRCHDFLGRSSSDTSTPEELKGYDGSLRIDVRMKKDSAELFRVNSTSDDEGPRKRSEAWLQRDGPRHSATHAAVSSSAQFSQEIEHLSSSADETEDERSEAEIAAVQAPPDTAVQPFQGIVNLAFDDMAEMDGENQRAPVGNTFMRSVLLSVDECEELGSDEGDTHPSRKAASLTPPDVFEKNSTDGSSKEDGRHTERAREHDSSAANHELSHEGSVAGPESAESTSCKGLYKAESELKSQVRPCHLDLYTETPSDAQRFCCTKTSNACKSQFLGRDNHAPSTENSNTALSAGHIDDIDSVAQTCMYDHRPPKSLSPIYEMDPADGIEQRLKTEPRFLDIEFEDQQFVERDWTLLRQLLADHGSDVDIINSVPEDLSLAQYLINQTLLLARENSKSQGKAWGDLSSPFEDSTSVTVTSFSPDECSSPHGEWTILELETHH